MAPTNVPMVTISQQEHDQLVEAQKFLLCLESNGVDNWQGYEHAQLMMEEME